MKAAEVKLLLTSSPFLKQEDDMPTIMRQVIYSLVPVSLAAIYYFGLGALLLILVCVGGALGTEWVFSRGKRGRRLSIADGSAILTGLLLALVLPPAIPLWMALLGAVAAIGIGKMVFGGVGSNIFNPALVGRAFLQAAFPVALTTWVPQGGWQSLARLYPTQFGMPFAKTTVSAVTTATPLSQMKFAGQTTDTLQLLLGNTGGSLGETCALIILLGGIYLAWRNYLNWRVPVAVFASVAVFAGILHWVDPLKYAPPMFHLFSGGLMLGAIYMATDPVTSPVTQRGCWIFGIGIGVLVMVIRTYGGLPEGVMYAILLMNAVSPLINRVTQARIYGESRKKDKG